MLFISLLRLNGMPVNVALGERALEPRDPKQWPCWQFGPKAGSGLMFHAFEDCCVRTLLQMGASL